MKFASLPISQLIQTPFACDCGRTHLADIRQVCIGQGVTSRIETFLAAQPTKGRMLEKALDELLIVCDPQHPKGVRGHLDSAAAGGRLEGADALLYPVPAPTPPWLSLRS